MYQTFDGVSPSEELNILASRHLGKAGNGSIVEPYQTPTEHDPTLLTPLPRKLNRMKSGIINSVFYGYEVWHAYEMSYLKKSGMPCTGVLRTCFPADSENMVESKSFKLYLNSFDLERFDSTEQVEAVIKEDLSKAAKAPVDVKLHEAYELENTSRVHLPSFYRTFRNYDSNTEEFTEYTENPDLLDFDQQISPEGATVRFHTSNLRSNCEITNQKDTGNCYIYISGKKVPTAESLMKYLISFRNSQHFHENATEIMYTTLQHKYNPADLAVMNLYNRRGGLDIHSFRATSEHLLVDLNGGMDYSKVDYMFKKTPQQ